MAYKSNSKDLLVKTDFTTRRVYVQRGADISWWDWEAGSRCHFLRWPEEYRDPVRDGQQPWFTGDGTIFIRSQKKSKEQIISEMKKGKVLEVWINISISSEEEVLILTRFFSVEK